MRSRTPLVAALLVGFFVVGFVGQGRWRIGAGSSAVAVSAAAVEVIGGSGGAQPRLVLSVAVLNEGSAPVRVLGTTGDTGAVTAISLDPTDAKVGNGEVERLNTTIAVDCTSATQLHLPGLRIARSDGVRRTVPIGGSGLLLDACGRSGAGSGPLALGDIRPDGGQLLVDVTSPTGRPTLITGVRAAGVPVVAAGLPLTVADTATLHLSAPTTCPVQWLVGGVPGALSFDISEPTTRTTPILDGGSAPSVATLQLRLGADLTSWLLDSSCRSRP